MKPISMAETEAIAVSSLGFDSTSADLTTPEALFAVIRKAASFHCPCTMRVLAGTVARLLRPLHSDEGLGELVQDAIDSLVGYGDLIEATDIEALHSGRLLYLAPPSFAEVSDQLFLIFGVVPDGEVPLPPELAVNLSQTVYSRRLRVQDAKETADTLVQAGYLRLKLDTWLKCPVVETASEFVAKYERVLTNSGPPGVPEDVLILDPDRPVKYYKGRWISLKRQTGRFIARRSQSYGSPLWCYIESVNGVVTRLLDFPVLETRWNPFDEAWHLSQAYDAIAGHAQVFRIRRDAHAGKAAMDFFSPVPAWATRRWDSIGHRTLPNSALFTYVFADKDFDTECRFAMERMWLNPL